MPLRTNGERIDDLYRATSRLDALIEFLQGDIDDVKKTFDSFRSQLHDLDTRIARIEENLKHARERIDKADPSERLTRVEEGLKNTTKELDKLRSNRFEIGKLILAAILGGAISQGFVLIAESIKARFQQPIQKANR